MVFLKMGLTLKTRLSSRRVFLIKFLQKFPKVRADRVCNPKSQNGRGTSSPSKKPTCGKCDKKHYGDCLILTGNFFGCGKSGNKVKYFSNTKGQDKGSGEDQDSDSNTDAP